MSTSSSMQDDGFGEVSYSTPAGAGERHANYSADPHATAVQAPLRADPSTTQSYAPGTQARGYPSPVDAPVDARGETRAERRARARSEDRGVPGFVALGILIAICGLGGFIDLVSGSSVKGAFNIALVIGAIVSIIVVRRSSMFVVVVAPPIVYFVASAVLLYVRSNGLKNRAVLLDAGVNWLVYGFPAIAGATAAVLIIAGIRMITGK
ncbi:hypothetical protein SAMN05892883_4343 [Jatrophihabitans sp. GAS493]|uniref:DUF6542 domain-containing protein n=1 Tax=Jatrophihabitans sp. GAS493 TaxID=1907575 RepID=UPI000BBFDD0A|nr:DUF6542 domain-containing protein [Jatrophihabitans sp. GAS493]SOD75138.1 hypothetical protein SAMN05892883_4343 [Jatrophihabitans sp. GAS493]